MSLTTYRTGPLRDIESAGGRIRTFIDRRIRSAFSPVELHLLADPRIGIAPPSRRGTTVALVYQLGGHIAAWPGLEPGRTNLKGSLRDPLCIPRLESTVRSFHSSHCSEGRIRTFIRRTLTGCRFNHLSHLRIVLDFYIFPSES
jgi:hypothetical protein